ncbi:hypothetical protein JNA64_01030 [Pseudomonas stutzeri]|uniref:hypothetical protein n=1 Tax=Stutzerimonas stutzeri TaxID=316 RepID=UPI001F523962|nr:hypothetical protein [Stutzerimonas stutzeri]MCI0915742.1 hypothetical protein [Stutzerimonas stutzeri]
MNTYIYEVPFYFDHRTGHARGGEPVEAWCPYACSRRAGDFLSSERLTAAPVEQAAFGVGQVRSSLWTGAPAVFSSWWIRIINQPARSWLVIDQAEKA